jgi:hypothetical protein
MPRKTKRVDEEIKQDLDERAVRRYLKRTHLPLDYPTLNYKARFEARKEVFSSWFDPALPHVLCDNVKNYVAAHYLFVEHYLKPDPLNAGTYFFEDPANKYEMVEMVMSSSLSKGEPNKTVLRATRRFGKTQTVIVEGMSLLCLARPYTLCLVSELNAQRTGEEIEKIKTQFEDNERIHSDFGGEGTLFPKRSGKKKWNIHQLDFLHHPGARIMGHSIGSAQRGRGPLFGVVDDPEDEENCFSWEWRRKFFDKLLGVYLQMFHWGGKICWIGTPVHEGSCLSQAMRGVSEQEGRRESDEPSHDARFDDWRKGRFSLIVRKKDGEFKSMQPERMSVAIFKRKMEIDPFTAMKEILCEPITPGTRAFKYDTHRHSYLRCIEQKDEDGPRSEKEMFLDLATGELIPWSEFIQETAVVGAGDLADGQSADADPGALVLIGVRDNNIYILDAFESRCLAERLVERAYFFAEQWECQYFGWERAALLTVINRLIRKYVDELRRKGRSPPIFRELENAKKNKVRRILTMTPLFGDTRVRFPLFRGVQLDNGRVFRPVVHQHEGHIQTLLSQVREFTDEGIRGHDDLIDSLEMSARLIPLVTGGKLEEEDRDENEETLEKWRKAGLDFQKDIVPQEAWTGKMKTESEKLAPVGFCGDVIPFM